MRKWKGYAPEATICKNCKKEFRYDTFRSRPRVFCCDRCKNCYCQKTYQSRMRKAYKIAKELIQ